MERLYLGAFAPGAPVRVMTLGQFVANCKTDRDLLNAAATGETFEWVWVVIR